MMLQAAHEKSCKAFVQPCQQPFRAGSLVRRHARWANFRQPERNASKPLMAFRSLHTVVAAVSDAPSLQLATAKLPKQIDEDKFATNMYQWAATLTSSGQNLPFTLPLSVKKLSNGFQMSLLRINNGEPIPVAYIKAEVEQEASVGNVFFVRFFEGEGSQLIRSSPLPKDPQQRLKLIIDGLIDISTIMKGMQAAIKQTAGRSLRPRES